MEPQSNANREDDLHTIYKKSICKILSLEKVPKEVIKQLENVSHEEKNEIIKELISSYNYLLTFYKNIQGDV